MLHGNALFLAKLAHRKDIDQFSIVLDGTVTYLLSHEPGGLRRYRIFQ